ncbi:MAG: hypothetical protein QME46_01470 [Thermoanaerobacteraceae bacterium]|nr:hypothetical protein [Thermoanaerobacteraceae bacterium]
MEIIRASSDHMILDVTHAGDIIGFKVSYSSMLNLTTSGYVDKVLAGEYMGKA